MEWMRNMAFYPTLFYNLVLNRISSSWAWYNRVDDTVVLGALPFKTMLEELKEKEKICGVVCLNLPHEMDHTWIADGNFWKENGVEHYWLPTPDFTHAPAEQDILHAVNFIRSFEEQNCSVYVHCKAGRTRSATVVMCYLIQKHGWSPDHAYNQLLQRRHQIILHSPHWNSVNSFYRRFVENSVQERVENET